MGTPIEDRISHLHPLEIKVLLSFREAESLFGSEIVTLSALQEAQSRMALEWLQKKSLIITSGEKSEEIATLTEMGKELSRKKMTEIRIIECLAESGGAMITELAAKTGENAKDTNIAVANLKKAGIVVIQEGGVIKQKEKADIFGFLQKQQVLEQSANKEIERREDVDESVWRIIEANSRKRGKGKGLFKITAKIDKRFELTTGGRAVLAVLLEKGVTGKEIGQLTPQMLKDGSWKTRRFRKYNIEGASPRIVVGKKNPYRQFLDFVKRKMIALGFEEMRGPLVESEFWNMDALYMPQFHPARAIHDAYFVASPTHCRELPEPNASNVANVHHNGGDTGSSGWRYWFDKERTKRLVLRSQGTALSARQLAMNPRIPGKYFAIARCFRYDAVDSTHTPDFFQVEGIMLGEEINIKHLLGLLKLFALEIARSKDVKFAPDYFPFTEPSVEVSMKHPQLGWIELGGAGIFRPEVTKPHGIDVPVIAWGLGLDRMAMVALGIHDIRDMFSLDLDLIRHKRVKAVL